MLSKKHIKKLVESVTISYKNTIKRVVDVEAPKNMVLKAILASIFEVLAGLKHAWGRLGPDLTRLQAHSDSKKPQNQ